MAALSHCQNMNIHARILVVSYPWQYRLLYRQMFCSFSIEGKKDTEQTVKSCRAVQKKKKVKVKRNVARHKDTQSNESPMNTVCE